MDKSIEEMREALRAAEQTLRQREADCRKANMAATPVVRRFTIKPDTDRWNEMYDDSCRLYSLSAEVTNVEQAKEAGHPDHDLRGGGMTYVFNSLSGRIVTGTGGGTIWVGTAFAGQKRESAHVAMEAISKFIVEHPEGGDITAIVEQHRK